MHPRNQRIPRTTPYGIAWQAPLHTQHMRALTPAELFITPGEFKLKPGKAPRRIISTAVESIFGGEFGTLVICLRYSDVSFTPTA